MAGRRLRDICTPAASSQQLAFLDCTVTGWQGSGDRGKYIGNPKWDIVAMVWSLGFHSAVVQAAFRLIYEDF